MSCKSKCKKSKCGCNSYNNCCPPNGGGATGPQGLPGVTGIQGPPGVTGIQGPPGVTGIEGPPGVTGIEGPPGVTGLQGPPGVTGLQGPPGVTGLAGGGAIIPFAANGVAMLSGIVGADLGFAPAATPVILETTELGFRVSRTGTITALAAAISGVIGVLPALTSLDITVLLNGSPTPLVLNFTGNGADDIAANVPVAVGDRIQFRASVTGVGVNVSINIEGSITIA